MSTSFDLIRSSKKFSMVHMLFYSPELRLLNKYYEDLESNSIGEQDYVQMMENPDQIRQILPFLEEEDFNKINKIVRRNREESMHCTEKFRKVLIKLGLYDAYSTNPEFRLSNFNFVKLTENPDHLKQLIPSLSSDSVDYEKLFDTFKTEKQKLEQNAEFLDYLRKHGLKGKYVSNVTELESPVDASRFNSYKLDPDKLAELSFLDSEDKSFIIEDLKKTKDSCTDLRASNFNTNDVNCSMFTNTIRTAFHKKLEAIEPLLQKLKEQNLTNDVFMDVMKQQNIWESLKKLNTFNNNEALTLYFTMRQIRKCKGQNLIPWISCPSRNLGSGTFGTVKLCTLDPEVKGVIPISVAAKYFHAVSEPKVLEELNILNSVSHVNIVNIWGYISSGNGFNAIVMEYVGSLTLETKLKDKRFKCFNDFPNAMNRQPSQQRIINDLIFEIASVCSDICNGMEYLSSKNIIHRDLKPDNIFISPENSVKIGDFGISKLLNDYENETISNSYYSIHYTAPEALPPKGKFSFHSDVWSYGVVLHQIWTISKFTTPFGMDISMQKVKDTLRLKNSILDITPVIDDCPQIFIKIIRNIYEAMDPPSRPTFIQIKESIDEWLKIPAIPLKEVEVNSFFDWEAKTALTIAKPFTFKNEALAGIDGIRRKIYRLRTAALLHHNKVSFTKNTIQKTAELWH